MSRSEIIKKSIAGVITAGVISVGIHFIPFAEPHPGRRDANGGHYNRKTGEYHSHLPGGEKKPDLILEPDKQPVEIVPELPSEKGTKLDYPTYDMAQETVYSVAKIVDGDTIKVEDENGKLVTVRLLGVDTPETKHPRKPVEQYGKEASYFTSNLLLGEKVYLIDSVESSTTDRFGRRLAYVFRACLLYTSPSPRD